MLPTAGQTYSIKVWVSEINDNADENNANDEITTSVFVNNGISGTKNVLVEEGTGAWCGYCPDGHLRMKDIKTQTPSVVTVMHHNGDGEATVGQNRGLWANRVATQANVPAPLEIKITSKTFDPASRKIDFTVEVKSVDYVKAALVRQQVAQAEHGELIEGSRCCENQLVGLDARREGRMP
eukprot:gene59702-79646_t